MTQAGAKLEFCNSECERENDDWHEGGKCAESGAVHQLKIVRTVTKYDCAVANKVHTPYSDETEADGARDSFGPGDAVSAVFKSTIDSKNQPATLAPYACTATVQQFHGEAAPAQAGDA